MAKKKKDKYKLKLSPALKQSLAYYLKISIIIVLLNFIYLTSFYSLFKKQLYLKFSSYLAGYIDSFALAGSLGLLIVLKVLVYSIIIENKDQDISNTPSLVFELMIRRFFPVFSTVLMVGVISGFLSLIFVVPGIICFTYCIFAPIASAVRDEDRGTIDGVKMIMGPKALAYSSKVVHGNFFRILIFNTIILAGLLALIQIPIFSSYTNSHDIDIIKHIAFDFWIVFNITSMLMIEKKQQKENDDMEQRYEKKFHFKR